MTDNVELANRAIVACATEMAKWSTTYGKQFGQAFYDDTIRKMKERGKHDYRMAYYYDPVTFMGRERWWEKADWVDHLPAVDLTAIEMQRLSRADTFSVTNDMQSFVDALAHDDLPDEISLNDVISPNGFIHLARPIPVIDIHGVRYEVESIHYDIPPFLLKRTDGSMSPFFRVSTYARHRLDDPSVPENQRFKIAGAAKKCPSLLDINIVPLRFLDILPSYDQGSPWRFLIHYLLVSNQKITTSSHYPATGLRTREVARKAHHVSGARVISLRREALEYDDHESRTVEWSHRWIVRTHWRTLHKDTPEERKVLIGAYVKGPPDKPLIEKKRSFVLER